MLRARFVTLTVAVLALAFVAGTVAAADKAEKKKGKLGDFSALTRLLPEGAEDKLKLTDDQKKQVAKIEEEFKQKTKESAEKLKDAFGKASESIKKARQDKDKAALRDAVAPLREPLQAVKAARDESQEKVKSLLNDEQKKTYDELKANEPGLAGPIGKILQKKKKPAK